MARRSSIPDVIDALIVLGRSLPEFAKVSVLDGIPNGATHSDVLLIDGLGDTTVDGQQSYAAIGRGRRKETYTVNCSISSERGGSDQRACRNRAFDLFDAYAGALEADPTLGGLVTCGQVSTVGLEQTEPDTVKGRIAIVTFQVLVENTLVPS